MPQSSPETVTGGEGAVKQTVLATGNARLATVKSRHLQRTISGYEATDADKRQRSSSDGVQRQPGAVIAFSVLEPKGTAKAPTFRNHCGSDLPPIFVSPFSFSSSPSFPSTSSPFFFPSPFPTLLFTPYCIIVCQNVGGLCTTVSGLKSGGTRHPVPLWICHWIRAKFGKIEWTHGAYCTMPNLILIGIVAYHAGWKTP